MSEAPKEELAEVEVDPLCRDPTAFWKERLRTHKVMRFKVKIPREPPAKGKVKQRTCKGGLSGHNRSFF